jgi:radical SAM protein with 4Fe4S-binding SPASM domain
MTMCARTPPIFQRSPLLRLRRESWGGIAFHRGEGDLLELDESGFAVLAALSQAQSLPGLCHTLRSQAVVVRLPELASFVRTLETQDFLRQVSPTTPALPPDPLAEACHGVAVNGLRAPLVAHWAVTYRCNLHCPFCYSESGPHREAGPNAETRLHIVERLAAWGILEVALGGGEPTILADFPALLAAIRKAGMVPNVTTNGVIHSSWVMQALADHAGIVHLSADRPELLDAARGAGIFARLQETARVFRRSGVRLGLNLLLTPDNVEDIARSLETALDLGVQSITLLRPKGEWAATHWPRFPNAGDLDSLCAGLRAFLAHRPPLRFYVDTALRGEWSRLGLFEDPEPEVRGCGGGQRHVAVTPEGDVYPCSHLRRPAYRLGNLLREDGAQLWTIGLGWQGRQRYMAGCRGPTCPCCLSEVNVDKTGNLELQLCDYPETRTHET